MSKEHTAQNLFVINSCQSSYPRGFEDIWQQICDYFGMSYLGASFIYSGVDNNQYLKNNIDHIAKAKAVLEIEI